MMEEEKADLKPLMISPLQTPESIARKWMSILIIQQTFSIKIHYIITDQSIFI